MWYERVKGEKSSRRKKMEVVGILEKSRYLCVCSKIAIPQRNTKVPLLSYRRIAILFRGEPLKTPAALL